MVKLPQHPPITSEPIIYGLVKFESAEMMSIKSMSLMLIKDTSETIRNFQYHDLLRSHALSVDLIKKCTKSISYYRKLSVHVWNSFDLEPDVMIDFPLFSNMVDFVDIFLIESQLLRYYKAMNIDEHMDLSGFENFLMAYDVLGYGSDDIFLLDLYDTFKIQQTPDFREFFTNKEGLDYSGFMECIHALGIRKESSEILKAFCVGNGCKESQISSVFMSHHAFKRAWVLLIDVNQELVKRDLTVETGLLTASRNEERLLRHISSMEEVYLHNLSSIRACLEDIKQSIRRDRDEKRIKAKKVKEKIHHQTDRFVASRGQERRLRMKKEQEERAAKRVEEKLLRIQLLQAQEENRRKREEDMMANLRLNEKLRLDQIRSHGWDRLNLSQQDLREIPKEIYSSEAAKARLSYAVMIDISKNLLRELPSSDFLYWMNSVRHLNLSTNRLSTLPEELRSLSSLEIFEAYQNKLQSFPEITGLTNLLRLDIASNALTCLPSSIGSCIALKYLSAHSNHLNALPSTIGHCMRLEFLVFFI